MARSAATSQRSSSGRRLYRQPAGERWWLSLLVVPALLTAGVVATQGHSIESALAADGTRALRAHGFPGSTVEVSGRDATVLVPTGEDEASAQQVVEAVDGVSDVSVKHVPRNNAERIACEDVQSKVNAAYHGRGIEFVPRSLKLSTAGAAAVRRVAVVLTKCPTANVVAEGHSDSLTKDGATLSLRRAESIRHALQQAGVKPTRVETRGFGDGYPVASDDTAQGRALNNLAAITVAED